MGDRANVVIVEDRRYGADPHEAVFLYTHGWGYSLPEIVRQALIRGESRWTDEPYLARIVFNEMTRDRQDDTAGFGISTRLTDNEHDLIVLYHGRLYRIPQADYVLNGFAFGTGESFGSIGFADYVARERTWDNLTEA